jgi:general stress protein 26
MAKNITKELAKLINSEKTCVIGSVDSDGTPNIKAMLKSRKITGIKTFYFSTNTSSLHARQFQMNPKASIYFHKRFIFHKGALLKGIMEILTDDNSKRMLWEKGDEKYYPAGVTDPDYCVMRFTALTARYYSKNQSTDCDIEDITGK